MGGAKLPGQQAVDVERNPVADLTAAEDTQDFSGAGTPPVYR